MSFACITSVLYSGKSLPIFVIHTSQFYLDDYIYTIYESNIMQQWAVTCKVHLFRDRITCNVY